MTVKGISRQVILVESPDPKLFDQAIFILKDSNAGVTEEQLLKEAARLIGYPQVKKHARYRWQDFLLMGLGATFTGLIWLVSVFF